MVISAKFESVCPVCSKGIELGSKVEWNKGQKAKHAECCKKPQVKTPNEMNGMDTPKIGMKVKSFLMIKMDKVTMGVNNVGEIIGFDGKYPVVDWKIDGEKPMTVKVINEERCTREKKSLCIWDFENRKQLYVV